MCNMGWLLACFVSSFADFGCHLLITAESLVLTVDVVLVRAPPKTDQVLQALRVCAVFAWLVVNIVVQAIFRGT